MSAVGGFVLVGPYYQMVDPLTGVAQHPLITQDYTGLREGSKLVYTKIFKKKGKSISHAANVNDNDPVKSLRKRSALDPYHAIALEIAVDENVDLESLITSEIEESSIDDVDEVFAILVLGSDIIKFVGSTRSPLATSNIIAEVCNDDIASLSSAATIAFDANDDDDDQIPENLYLLTAENLGRATASISILATAISEQLASSIASPSSISGDEVNSSAMFPNPLVNDAEPERLSRRFSSAFRRSTSSASYKPPSTSSAVADSAVASIAGTASRSTSIQSHISSHSIVTVNQRVSMNGAASVDKKYYHRPGADTSDNASVQTNNSVIYLALDDLLEQNPELTAELEVLKKSIDDHVRSLRHERIVITKSLEYQIDELCENLAQKDDELKQNVTLIEKAYRKVDAAEARLEASKEELKQADTSRGIWEHEYKLKAREIDIERRTHNSKIINLEREKRGLVEKLQYMEANLETERVRADGAEYAKMTAMASAEGMRKHFDFYRNYYEAQAGLHRQYVPGGSSSASSMHKGKGREVSQAGEDGKKDEVTNGAVQRSTQSLREQYLKMLESDEGGERIRGFEFLAELERNSGAHNAKVFAIKKDEDEIEGSELAVESDDETDTTFTSNFLSTRH